MYTEKIGIAAGSKVHSAYLGRKSAGVLAKSHENRAARRWTIPVDAVEGSRRILLHISPGRTLLVVSAGLRAHGRVNQTRAARL